MFSIVMVLVVTTVIGTVIAVNVSVDADKPLHSIMDYVK